MKQDWLAVAAAIEDRMTILGLTQQQLAERCGVALSIVRELRHNTVQRRRRRHTLEAISVGLGLPPHHLRSIAIGQSPPKADRSIRSRTMGLPREIASIETRLDELTTNMSALDAKITEIVDHIRSPRSGATL